MDLRLDFEPIIMHQLDVLLTLSALQLEWIRYMYFCCETLLTLS